MTYDVVVVGGGAAGLNAASVLAQARRRVLVIDAGTPRNAPAARMRGYLSREGANPAELLRTGREEVRSYGGEVMEETVTGVGRDGEEFLVEFEGRAGVRARRLLVATGLRDELPPVPGLAERWGRDVLHCPYCHGHEVRDEPIAVLGTDEEGPEHALMLRQWSDDVTLLQQVPIGDEDRRRLDARDVSVVEGPVTELVVENDRLTGVRVTGRDVVPVAAMFVTPGSTANDDLLIALGCEMDENGWVRTDPDGLTSVPGVWAAGNVAHDTAHVITAAGNGLVTAIAVNADLVEADVRAALAARAAAPAEQGGRRAS
ncbi:NAD(P)/FAD-dependent oxidoreductase [Streptosporangium longisporum]|uniref:NAD(P)/FAD-dependent oxidoreductase n=1 Tax=Streptosporangium longisporum TaxID=46187 RepID=A0ABP6L5E4_9ACTN